MRKSWVSVALGEVLRHRKEFVQIEDTETYRRCRVQLHAQGIVLRDQVSGLAIKTKKQQVCKAGEFLVAEIDAKHGGYGILPNDLDGAIVSSHYFLFGINTEQLDRQFLAFFTKTPSFAEQVAAQGSTNYAAIRPSHVLAYRIPLPPIAEQRRIVARIEELAGRLADARGLRVDAGKAIESLYVRSVANVIDWDSTPNLSLGDLLREGTLNGLGLRPSDSPPGHPILRISAGTSRSDATVAEDDVRYLDVGEPEVQKYRLAPDDLLACRFNGNLHYVGRFSRFVGRSAGIRLYPDKLIRFRVDLNRAVPAFVCLMANSPRGRERIESYCATTAGNIGISAGELKTVQIPVPPMAEQRRIIDYLDDLAVKADVLKRLQAETAAELDALMPSVLDRAFRGEL